MLQVIAMKKRTKPPGSAGENSAWISLFMMLFAVGAVVGSFFAANMSESGQEYIYTYFIGGTPVSVWRAILTDTLPVILVFVCGFFSVGRPVTGLVITVKGFIISALATTFVMIFGAGGYIVSLALILVCGFVSAMCLILISLQAVAMSARRAVVKGRGPAFVDKAYYFSGVICLAATLAVSIVNIYLLPIISGLVVRMLV